MLRPRSFILIHKRLIPGFGRRFHRRDGVLPRPGLRRLQREVLRKVREIRLRRAREANHLRPGTLHLCDVVTSFLKAVRYAGTPWSVFLKSSARANRSRLNSRFVPYSL